MLLPDSLFLYRRVGSGRVGHYIQSEHTRGRSTATLVLLQRHVGALAAPTKLQADVAALSGHKAADQSTQLPTKPLQNLLSSLWRGILALFGPNCKCVH